MSEDDAELDAIRKKKEEQLKNIVVMPEGIIHLESPEHFNELIEKYQDFPIVIDFWAEWCGPCKMFGPVFEKAQKKWGDRFVFVKLDTEAIPAIAESFQVTGIPMVSFIKGKKEVHRQAGAMRRAQFDQLLEAVTDALGKVDNPTPSYS